MTKLQPVDKVEIQVLVYNATDGLSTTPSNVENEFAFATRRGLRASSGRCLCCAVHGFSVLLTATRGGVNEEIIPQTVKAIREFGLTQIAAVHCIGWRAIAAPSAAFGDNVVAPTAVGKRYTF